MNHFFLILIFFLFLCGCGRKQKNIFYFPQEKPKPRVNKLSLQSVRGVKVSCVEEGVKISWQSIYENESLRIADETKSKKEFLGYDVYKLVNAVFVPKKSLNDFPIKDTEFIHKEVLNKNAAKDDKCNCYIIKTVFNIYDQIVFGPASMVACQKNYPPT